MKLFHYTVELRRPESGWKELEQATARAREASDEMRRHGAQVRFLRAVFVPEDDSCFFLFEGPTAAAVRDVAGRARLQARHVRKTITRLEQKEGER